MICVLIKRSKVEFQRFEERLQQDKKLQTGQETVQTKPNVAEKHT